MKKFKKCFSIISAALLMASALSGCAERDTLPEKNESSEQSVETTTSKPATSVSQTETSAPETSSPIVSQDEPTELTAYERLIAFKTDNYKEQSVADFNATFPPTFDELKELLAALDEVNYNISKDDENYEFITTTLTFSSRELNCEHMGEEFTFRMSISKKSRLRDYMEEDEDGAYDFTCYVAGDAAYSISDPKHVTVAERDAALLTYKEEMQNYLNSLSEEEITNGDIQKMLNDKSAEFANSLSTEKIKLSPCNVNMVDIYNLEPMFTQ